MSPESVIEELKEFVIQTFLDGQGDGLDATTPLLEWGVIDSIALVSLLNFIKERFHVQVPNAELKPANVTNLRAIAALVLRLRDGEDRR